jgi:hypothetical protein
MLKISAEQMATLKKNIFDNYVDRLVAEAEQILAVSHAGATASTDGAVIRPDAGEVVMTILRKAKELGIRCEGDVTPFFRMAICTTPEFRKTAGDSVPDLAQEYRSLAYRPPRLRDIG